MTLLDSITARLEREAREIFDPAEEIDSDGADQAERAGVERALEIIRHEFASALDEASGHLHRVLAVAEGLKVDNDEDGFHLHVDADGIHYDFRIQGVACEFAGTAGYRSLGEYLGERETVQAEHTRAARGATASSDSRECRAGDHEDCDEAACECDCHTLAPDDPKHPTYAERMIS